MFLLDTNAILFYVQGDERLSPLAKKAMELEKCFFSSISLWEIAIKQNLKKLNFFETIPHLWKTLEAQGFEYLAISPESIEQTKQLPLIHRDPFDRLLIAQAQTENLTIITRDTIIPQYNIKTIW